APRWIFGTGIPSTRAYVAALTATSDTAMYTRSSRKAPLGCSPARATCRRRSASGVRCWMKKIGSGFPAPRLAASQRSSCPPRAGPRARDRLAPVAAASSHRRHVRREIVALHRDVAKAAATGQEFGKPRVGASGSDRGARVAQAQDLEVVVLLKGDRVVSR